MKLIRTENSGLVKVNNKPRDNDDKPESIIVNPETPEDRKTAEFFSVSLDELEKQATPKKKKVGRHNLNCNCENCIEKRGYDTEIGKSNIPKPEHIGGVLRAFNILLRKVSQPLTNEEIIEGEKVLFPIYKDLFPKFGGEKSKYYEPGIWLVDKLFATRTYDFSNIYKKSAKVKKDELSNDKTTGNPTSERPNWNKQKT